MRFYSRAIAGVAIASLMLTVTGASTRAIQQDDVGERPLARAPRAMVAASNPRSTEAALEILRKGGNAVDAAIAASLVAMVVEPNMVAFGGFGSLIAYDAASRQSRFMTFWMQYPQAFNPDAKAGPGAYVIAPGAPKGLHQAATKYGKLPFSEIVGPAIRIAREGFPIYGSLYGQMFERYGFLTATEEGRATWTREGFLPAPGSIFRQPALAETLHQYARQGPDYIYNGPFAKKLVDTVQRYGGRLTHADLRDYQALESEPGRSTYRDVEIRSSWPPDSGGLGLALAMNILEALDLRKSGPYTSSIDSAYYVYATLRTVQEMVGFVRDPGVYNVPAELLLSKEFAARQAQRIRDAKTLAGRSGRKGAPPTETVQGREDRAVAPSPETGTVHISVVDEAGNACGITSSIAGDTFGQSGLVVDGVLINGSGRFRPAGSHDSRWSSLAAPSLLFRDGQLLGVIGSPSDVYSTMTQVLVNLVDFGMDPQAAVSAPRMYARRATFIDTDAAYLLETRFDPKVLAGLKALNASVDARGAYANPAGAARVVIRDRATGQLLGGTDPRRPGLAKGY
ncbi:MAG: gamma-glutamyltransferase [Acidobacteriota bacterium]|nr:gamma-glutamyltransferase [Acidobacteriota bacterium]